MNVLVIGATGATGRIIVELALERGHRVTAMARNPQDLVLAHDWLRVVRGDVLQPETLQAAMVDQEVVIFAAGSGGLGRSTLRTVGALNTVEAMEKSGVKRLIAMSGLGAGDSRASLPLLVRVIIAPLVLGRLLRDQNGLEEAVRQSSVEWTLVRPGELRDAPGHGDYKLSTDGRGISSRVSRADVAKFIVDQIGDSTYSQQALSIGH